MRFDIDFDSLADVLIYFQPEKCEDKDNVRLVCKV